jgi:hypothetical protein
MKIIIQLTVDGDGEQVDQGDEMPLHSLRTCKDMLAWYD